MAESGQQRSKGIFSIIATLVTFLGFVDTTLLLPVMALYAARLGASVGTVGLVIGLYSITNTPANILFGWLIDRAGFKAPLVAGMTGDALSMFLYSLTRSPVHLALVRALHGTSGGLIGPATMYIFSGSTGTARGRAMAVYGVAVAAATLAGFAMSGVIASRWSYKVLFYVGAGLLGIGAALSLLLPGRKPETATKAGVSLRETLRQVRDLLPRRGLRLSYAAIFSQYFTFGSIVTLLPIYVKGLGMEAFHVGMLLAAFTVMFIVAQFPSGVLSDRTGRLPAVIAGLGLGIVSLVVLPLLKSFPLLAVAMAVYGVAYGLLFPSVSAIVADHTSPQERGLGTGLFHALLTAGVAVGAPISGWVGEGLGIRAGIMLTPVILLLPLFLALRR